MFSLENVLFLAKQRSKRRCRNLLRRLCTGVCLKLPVNSYGLIACYQIRDVIYPSQLICIVIIKPQYILHTIRIFHERRKHLRLDFHYVRDHIKEGFIVAAHVKSSFKLGDTMMKFLTQVQHQLLSSKLGLCSRAPFQLERERVGGKGV